MFTAKKCEDICPSSHKLQVPHIRRIEYQVTHTHISTWHDSTSHHSLYILQLLNIESDSYLSLMDEEGGVREDLCLPKGQLGQNMTKLFESGEDVAVTVTQAAGHEAITAVASGRQKRGKGVNSF